MYICLVYTIESVMKFEPNPEKEAINIRLHGISFEPAKQAFDDPNAAMSDNYFVGGEQRLQVIGMTRGLLLLLVVCVDKTAGDEII